jgi:hypothetical protein
MVFTGPALSQNFPQVVERMSMTEISRNDCLMAIEEGVIVSSTIGQDFESTIIWKDGKRIYVGTRLADDGSPPGVRIFTCMAWVFSSR